MSAIRSDPDGQLSADADAAIRQLYCRHAGALHFYVERFCTDRTSADNVVQEPFIRAWRHLAKLSADDRPIRPGLFRVARNLVIDADRAARSRPVIVQALPEQGAGTDAALARVLDRELVSAAFKHLSPAHREVLIEAFYNGESAFLSYFLSLPLVAGGNAVFALPVISAITVALPYSRWSWPQVLASRLT